MPSVLIDNPIAPSQAPAPKRKRKSKAAPPPQILDSEGKDEEEKRLESLLFATTVDLNVSDESEAEYAEDLDDLAALGFVIDKGHVARAVSPMEEATDEGEEGEEGSDTSDERKPAWHDPDDDEMHINIASKSRLRKLRNEDDEEVVSAVEYQKRLRAQFQKVHPAPNWALSETQRGKDSSELLKLLQSTDGILSKNSFKALPQEVLEVTRVKDANQLAYSQAVIQALSWHPNAQVLLTAGLDKTIRLFQIDGKVNPHLQNIFLRDLPIHQASFTRDGREIIAAGRRRYFYSFDLQSGQPQKIWDEHKDDKSLESFVISPDDQYIAFLRRDGYIGLASRSSKQWIADFKMSSSVKSVDFSSDGKTMYSISRDGEVYHWDLGERRCIHRFHDEGAIKPRALAASFDGGYIATGYVYFNRD